MVSESFSPEGTDDGPTCTAGFAYNYRVKPRPDARLKQLTGPRQCSATTYPYLRYGSKEPKHGYLGFPYAKS